METAKNPNRKFKDGTHRSGTQARCRRSRIQEENHLFILLGYTLDDEGQMQETLINRLEHALKLLKNPTAKIIVTGGVPKKENTGSKTDTNG